MAENNQETQPDQLSRQSRKQSSKIVDPTHPYPNVDDDMYTQPPEQGYDAKRLRGKKQTGYSRQGGGHSNQMSQYQMKQFYQGPPQQIPPQSLTLDEQALLEHNIVNVNTQLEYVNAYNQQAIMRNQQMLEEQDKVIKQLNFDIKSMKERLEKGNRREMPGGLFFNRNMRHREKDLENLVVLGAFDSDLNYYRGGNQRSVMQGLDGWSHLYMHSDGLEYDPAFQKMPARNLSKSYQFSNQKQNNYFTPELSAYNMPSYPGQEQVYQQNTFANNGLNTMMSMDPYNQAQMQQQIQPDYPPPNYYQQQQDPSYYQAQVPQAPMNQSQMNPRHKYLMDTIEKQNQLLASIAQKMNQEDGQKNNQDEKTLVKKIKKLEKQLINQDPSLVDDDAINDMIEVQDQKQNQRQLKMPPYIPPPILNTIPNQSQMNPYIFSQKHPNIR